MDKELELVGRHEQKETFSLHFKPYFSKHKDDQSSEGYTILFSEDCNNPVKNFVSNGFNENFSPHIYDEYEEDYLDVVPKKPVEGFATYELINGENMIAIHDQIFEDGADSECTENECFPLCFSSFELLKQRFRVSKGK